MKTHSPFSLLRKSIGKYFKGKLVFSFILLTFLRINLLAQPANIIIQPAPKTTTVGQSFTVAVRIDFTGTSSPQGVDVVEVHLTFDKTKLQVTNITKSAVDVLPSEAIALQSISTINTNGQINYNAGTSSDFPTTDFDFLTITFNAINGGGTSTPLTFLTNFPSKTDAIRNFTSVLGSTINGTINIQNVSLPVSLLNLSASPLDRKVTLRWSTSSEINNKGFDVMRSTDGVNWSAIGYVAGAGNSSSARNYTYADDNLDARRYYYRLKQIDIDDHIKYSVIVSAVIGSKGEYVLGQNYPNPFRTETTIQYTLPQAGQVNLSLFDINGRTIKVLVNASKEAGTHTVGFNTGALTKGIYYYRIQAGNFTDVKKLTIQ